MPGELIQHEHGSQQNHDRHEHCADHVRHESESPVTEAGAESDLEQHQYRSNDGKRPQRRPAVSSRVRSLLPISRCKDGDSNGNGEEKLCETGMGDV